jgi:hypothetical protein
MNKYGNSDYVTDDDLRGMEEAIRKAINKTDMGQQVGVMTDDKWYKQGIHTACYELELRLSKYLSNNKEDENTEEE